MLASVTDERHALQLDAEVDQGRRLELARVAARLEQEEMAQAVGISVRSYQRTIAGTRTARRGELIAWAELTGQDLDFFSGASSNERAQILSQTEPPVKRRRKAAA
jgi:transcriptional regulator with XRE-family HTH domain